MTDRTLGVPACLLIATASLALAQTSTNINFNLTTGNSNYIWSNMLVLAQTGLVGSLGTATLAMISSSSPISDPHIGETGVTGPVQVTFKLAFNEIDTIVISFTENDPNFAGPTNTTVAMTGGTITGGTGAYAGATGSLDLTIVKDSAGAMWSTSSTTGSGTLTVGGSTTPLTLSNFRGWCCGWSTREQDYFTVPLTVSGNLGNATGTIVGYYYLASPMQVSGTATLTFNSTDSLILGFSYPPASGTDPSPPSTFSGNIHGGTGKYANAAGALTYTTTSKGYTVTGALTTSPGAAITQVKTIYGLPQIAFNTWLEIHGQNLVPADTPAAGVDWSNAPDFANGQMPTQLGPVSVSFGGGATPTPGYVYWYCSAQTNPNCADDQINVLAPTALGLNDASPMRLAVNNNGVPIADTSAFRVGYSPAFLSFDVAGHIAARHLDASLMGPSNLYPGLSTPAKAGETIALYGTGFGPVSPAIVAGSATQSGSMGSSLSCWIAGLNAPAVGALVSPGLYQINLTVPNGVPSGDNPVNCIYAFYPTFPGAVIAVR